MLTMSGAGGNEASSSFAAQTYTQHSVTAACSRDTLLDAIIRYVFKDLHIQAQGRRGMCLDGQWNEPLNCNSIQHLIRQSLDHLCSTQVPPVGPSCGRLGPSKVQFDETCRVGKFKFEFLILTSEDNFATIKANTCVFKGKWQYELMLGTKGVMQVGWATLGCQFSAEKGVGDTQDSYGYDGNRQRKWNVATYKYGEMWQCGDIISCTIDLDEGIVHFYRNGRSLGPAFTNVKTGPEIAYFPAVSLALGENLVANFGATPFRYPQEGFAPLEDPPTKDLQQAQQCFDWLKCLEYLDSNWLLFREMVHLEENCRGGRNARILQVAYNIINHLGPLLTTPYVVEACLVPTLAQLANISHSSDVKGITGINLTSAHHLIDFLLASLEIHEQLKCIENLIICLLTGLKQTSESIEFKSQKFNLRLLYVLLSHRRLRQYCLSNILFDKVKFPSFVNMKVVDEEGLNAVVPQVWWSSKDSSLKNGVREAYQESCDTIQQSVQEVEDIQLAILNLLLKVDDGVKYADTSRALFLSKFRIFLKDHSPGSRILLMAYTPLPVILCLFHRLLSIFQRLWLAEIGTDFTSIPPRMFYDGTVNYFDTHRLGGLESHLMKTLREEIARAKLTDSPKVINTIDSATAGPSTGVEDLYKHSEPSTSGALLGNAQCEGEEVQQVNVTMCDNGGAKDSERCDSLLQLLDGVILLYHIGAHKQLGKVAAQRDSMNDNINHVQEIHKKLDYCREKELQESLMEELHSSEKVFLAKLEEQARQQAWVLAAVHSKQKQEQLVWLLKVVLNTLKDASKQGELFAFVPDFYVDSLTEMCTALRLYFTYPTEDIPGYTELLIEVGEFLALNFCDSRIVYADSKDSLIQALAGFVCHQSSLNALESMPRESQITMVRNLLQPYDNRAWAQNNWILVRFWKGCGFGFRYTKSPHFTNKLRPKPFMPDSTNFQATAPTPSHVFQQLVVQVLEESEDVATPFLNSLLNQLNWAFSEFIGMLQEIQNASNRPERVFIDSRQLRICATCFDLALALLRVIEMIVNLAPQLFIDCHRPNSEVLLSRLCKLLWQMLNRVSGWSGCFSHVVSLEIPGLESIHHYPILTAVTGLLTSLIRQDLKQGDRKQHTATKTLLNESSFELTSVYQLLGGQDAVKGETFSSLSSSLSSSSVAMPPSISSSTPSSTNSSTSTSATRFSLRQYPGHVSEEEVQLVEEVVRHLEQTYAETKQESSSADDDEDSLCTICYAKAATTHFLPCSHTSCRACITQHLMNHLDCFFCKATINSVIEQSSGNVVYPIEGQDRPRRKNQ